MKFIKKFTNYIKSKYLTLFNNYVVMKDLIFTFDNYRQMFDSFESDIIDINNQIMENYRHERFLLSWFFKNREIMFINTVKAYFSIDDNILLSLFLNGI